MAKTCFKGGGEDTLRVMRKKGEGAYNFNYTSRYIEKKIDWSFVSSVNILFVHSYTYRNLFNLDSCHLQVSVHYIFSIMYDGFTTTDGAFLVIITRTFTALVNNILVLNRAKRRNFLLLQTVRWQLICRIYIYVCIVSYTSHSARYYMYILQNCTGLLEKMTTIHCMVSINYTLFLFKTGDLNYRWCGMWL